MLYCVSQEREMASIFQLFLKNLSWNAFFVNLSDKQEMECIFNVSDELEMDNGMYFIWLLRLFRFVWRTRNYVFLIGAEELEMACCSNLCNFLCTVIHFCFQELEMACFFIYLAGLLEVHNDPKCMGWITASRR